MSRAGGALGKAIFSKTGGNNLCYGGGLFGGIDSYQSSDKKHTSARVAEGVSKGATSAMKYGSLPVTLADMAMKKVGLKDYTLGKIYDSLSSTVGGVVDLAKGNDRALDSVHEKNIRGDQGKITQSAVKAGEWRADEGFGGGMKEFGAISPIALHD